jgi:hypothetical protein
MQWAEICDSLNDLSKLSVGLLPNEIQDKLLFELFISDVFPVVVTPRWQPLTYKPQ